MKTRVRFRGERRRFAKNSIGTVMAFTLVVIAILGIVIGGVLSFSVMQRRMADRFQIYTQEFSVAEMQLGKALGEISYALKKAGVTNPQTAISKVSSVNVPGYSVDQFAITLVGDQTGRVNSGTWTGYNLRQLTYRIFTTVRRSDAHGSLYKHPGVSMRQDFRISYVPLYVFGIFYDNDLEINNGQSNFQETGRTHTNASFYYGADGKTQDWKDYVTAVGHMQYGRNPNTPQYASGPPGISQGTNRFVGPNGVNLVSANVSGVRSQVSGVVDHANLDWQHYSNGNTWANQAKQLWADYVKDFDMGVSRLDMPWPVEVIPSIEVIQPANPTDSGSLLIHKMAYKAGLYIVRQNGTNYALKPTGFDANGNPVGISVPLTYTLNGQQKSVVSTSTFFDDREGPYNVPQYANQIVFNVDLRNMREAGIAPANGIVYIMNMDGNGSIARNECVRLLNGSELPGDPGLGFSIATPNSLYVQGDYNSVNTRLAMLAADALTVLSQGWSDRANDRVNGTSPTPAASATMAFKAVCVTGNVPSQKVGTTRYYSGGVENYFRFLENWGGDAKPLNFTGSIINLFPSKYATGWWTGAYQSAPRRNFDWDPGLANAGPPGSPIVFATEKLDWGIEYAN